MSSNVSLIFHGIGTPKRALEPGEELYWISQSRFERVLDMVLTSSAPSRISITFDDGNLSDYEIGMPCLAERGMTAEVFVLSGRLGKIGSLDAEHLKDLIRNGFRIGSHGVAHLDWRRLGSADLMREVVSSREAIEAAIEARINSAAIPFGGYNARVLAHLRQAGYTVAWSSDRGPFNDNAFLRPRTSIRADTSDEALKLILSAQLGIKNQLKRAFGMARRRNFNF